MLSPYDLKQNTTFFEAACKIMIMIADEIKVDSLNRRRLEQNVKDLENRLMSPFIKELGSVDTLFRFFPYRSNDIGCIELRVEDLIVYFGKPNVLGEETKPTQS
jgi:hypothetical protein